MAFDSDAQSRKLKREKLRQERLAQQRRLKIRLIAAAAALVAIGLLIYAVRANAPRPATPAAPGPSNPSVPAAVSDMHDIPVPATQAPMEPTTVIHFIAAGDLTVCDEVVNTGGGQYDFSQTFLDVLPLLAEGDLTALNLEGNVVGAPYGTDTHSAPENLLTALADAGVDIVQVANSYSIRNGISGLMSTIQAVRNAGMEPVGAYATNRDFRDSGGYTIMEVKGVRVAIVAFTKGMDGMGLPEGSEDCVNLLYNDYATTYREVNRNSISRVLRAAAAERPDITIALLHWGSEYNDVISYSQKVIKQLMLDGGVDVIIGTHSHYVQPMEYDEENGTFVCYSLGDFFGDAVHPGSNYSVVLDLEITKDNETEEARVTGYSYTPIFTVSENGVHRVVRIQEAMIGYDVNYVDRVTLQTYERMTNALERIEARVTPETTDDNS